MNQARALFVVGVRALATLVIVCMMSACTLTNRQASIPDADIQLLLQKFDSQEQQRQQTLNLLEALNTEQKRQAQQLRQLQTELSQVKSMPSVVLPDEPAMLPAPEGLDAVAHVDSLQEKLLLGRVEWLWFESVGHYLKARIDTGLMQSYLNVQSLILFERDGQRWSQFKLAGAVGDRVELQEFPVVRVVKDKHAGSSERLPVVSVLIRIGDFQEAVDFALVQRDSTVYPVSLGRSFLTDTALVDVSRKFIHKRLPRAEESGGTDRKPEASAAVERRAGVLAVVEKLFL